MRVVFEADPGTRQLRATHIESELGITRPDDAAWPLARKIALCAASTYISLVRHFNWVHLACGGPVAIVTRNELPHDHPLKRLLWPHMFGTQYSNAIATKGQMAPGGDFDSIFSFTHAGMCQLFRDSYDKYPITVIDPERDAQRRGVLHGEFDQPSLHNLTALFAVMHAHADRYVRAYYNTDGALRADQSVRNWLDHMDKLIPNGIGALVDDVNRASVARFIGGLIYMATVQHDVLGTSMWNYQMWVDKQPVRIYRNGQREPLDVFQRLVNANFNLNVNRKNLLDDFSYLGLDETGRALFRQFQDDLKVLQGKMEAEEFAYWKIYPTILEANINA
jgi:arachidonate 15-lipoxygenase